MTNTPIHSLINFIKDNFHCVKYATGYDNPFKSDEHIKNINFKTLESEQKLFYDDKQYNKKSYYNYNNCNFLYIEYDDGMNIIKINSEIINDNGIVVYQSDINNEYTCKINNNEIIQGSTKKQIFIIFIPNPKKSFLGRIIRRPFSNSVNKIEVLGGMRSHNKTSKYSTKKDKQFRKTIKALQN
jgi:hypothetical protein